MGYGFRGHIGVAKETTWGSATAVTSGNYVEALSESLVTTLERFESRNIIGGSYDPDDETGIQRNEGDIVAAAHPVQMGHFLKGAFGVNSVTSLGLGLFRNTFTVAQTDTSTMAPLPSYTFEIFRDVTSANQFFGAQIGALSLSIAPNQDLRMTASIIAKGRNSIAATTPTFPGSPAGVFKFTSASLEMGGAAAERFEALTINIDNQIEGIPGLNGSERIMKVKRTGPPLVAITGTVTFDDMTDKDSFLAQTELAMRVTLIRANSFQLVIEVPRFIYTTFPDQMQGRDRVSVDFEGKGRYHAGSGTSLKIALTTTNTY